MDDFHPTIDLKPMDDFHPTRPMDDFHPTNIKNKKNRTPNSRISTPEIFSSHFKLIFSLCFPAGH